jgi:hypothetical protein
MFKTTITFALFDSQAASYDKKVDLINQAMTYLDIEGATLTENTGGYVMKSVDDNEPQLVIEPSYSIEVVTDNALPTDLLDAYVQDIKIVEDQEAVMVTVQRLEAYFI